MSFHERLHEARKRAGLTQAQLAERIGVAKTTYTGYEIGRSEPDMNRTVLLMQHLGVDANYLWQDEMANAGAKPMDLSEDALAVARAYDKLDAHGRRVVSAVLELEVDRCSYPIPEERIHGMLHSQQEVIDKWFEGVDITDANEA